MWSPGKRCASPIYPPEKLDALPMMILILKTGSLVAQASLDLLILTSGVYHA